MSEHHTFDPVTLEYAMKRNILYKIDNRFDQFCIYFLEKIDKEIMRKCKEFSRKHRQYGCLFEHDDSFHDELYSKVLLRYKEVPYVEFHYGFEWDIKLKIDNEMAPSKDGCDFYITVGLNPKIMENKTKLNSYYKTLEGYFTNPEEGYASHSNEDDNGIYFYWDINTVDKNFSIKKRTKAVVKAFESLFYFKHDLDLFIKKIPEKRL